MAKLADYVRGGGKIIAVGELPSMAPGYADARRITSQVTAAAKALQGKAGVTLVTDDAAVGAALAKALTPDLKLASQSADVGFIRRKLTDGDIYFIANTSNREVRTTATLRATRKSASWWNPHDGTTSTAKVTPMLELVLAPYESRILVLSDGDASGRVASPKSSTVLAYLGSDWQLRFPGEKAQSMPQLRSWTDDPSRRFFSGIAVYSKDVELSASQLGGATIRLDFGKGTPLDATPKVPAGMRAMMDSPIREAAEVFVNGRRAGSVWHPPYELDITSQLREGVNKIEVKVANLSLNALAGQERPDYRLLSARDGQRFVPQDTHLIVPTPSGMLGPVRLLTQPKE
jgi:hypothetical protein